eukprot:scaffold441_cov382-Prasinococcus_capsulatus_cf.AAC.3
MHFRQVLARTSALLASRVTYSGQSGELESACIAFRRGRHFLLSAHKAHQTYSASTPSSQ